MRNKDEDRCSFTTKRREQKGEDLLEARFHFETPILTPTGLLRAVVQSPLDGPDALCSLSFPVQL